MEDNNKYYLTDQETGERYSVTKEVYETYKLFFEQVKKCFKPENKGIVFVVGTGSEDKTNFEDFKKWGESDNFKTIDFNGFSINK